MSKRCFLKYPCGKLFELRVPLSVLDMAGKIAIIVPGDDYYYIAAKKKFEINNLEVIEMDIADEQRFTSSPGFISLSRTMRSIH